MEGWGFWTVAVVAAVCVGMGKGGMPVVAMLSVPLLSLYISPIAAAGLLLPIYVVSDMFGLWAYRRDFNKRVIVIVCIGATAGVALGWATASLVSERVVEALVGLVGAVFAVMILTQRRKARDPRPAKVGPGLFWGVVSGFTSFVSHGGGPPYQVYTLPLGMTKTVFAGTTTITFAYVNAIKLIPYWALGQLSAENLHVAAWLALPSALAVFLGVRLVRVLPEALFFKLVTWALLAVSLQLLWRAASGG